MTLCIKNVNSAEWNKDDVWGGGGGGEGYVDDAGCGPGGYCSVVPVTMLKVSRNLSAYNRTCH